MSVGDIKLSESPVDTWANTILYRLAIALGRAQNGDGTITLDPDELLQDAEEHIASWRDDRCFT